MDRAVVACLLAVLVGGVAGLRSMTAPAAIAWAAWLGRLGLAGTWLAFFGQAWTPWIFTLLAAGELVIDQLPSTPSRKQPAPFAARVLLGAVCGAALTAATGSLLPGAVAGVAGAVAGTLGGHALRARLALAFGADRPAALLEDAVAIALACIVVLVAR
ncbi:MAG: DUF4126 domain-containing protein [Vicinamibacteria bacterium]